MSDCDIYATLDSRKFQAALAGTLMTLVAGASSRGRHAEAEWRFEAAARGYRDVLDVEALARLRVQQRMVRARASGDPVREAEMMLEIVRGLNRLDRLESFAAPHELKDAREVLSEWLSGSDEAFAADSEEARLTA